MNAVFADAYYFIALLNPRDAGHRAAQSFPQRRNDHLITTEWVLIEVGNALSAPLLRGKFIQLVTSLRARKNATILHSTPELFNKGFSLYSERPDKSWSLTDCLSFIVMQENGVSEALTADAHFEQVACLNSRT